MKTYSNYTLILNHPKNIDLKTKNYYSQLNTKHRSFHVDQLEIKSSIDGFLLRNNNGFTQLADQDRIHLAHNILEVKIIKQDIGPSYDPGLDDPLNFLFFSKKCEQNQSTLIPQAIGVGAVPNQSTTNIFTPLQTLPELVTGKD